MDNDTKALAGALVMLLLAFPLTAWGTDRDITWLWMLGLAAIAVGSAIPPVMRLAGGGSDDDGDGDGDGEADDEAGER
jgi:hypothetical protein